MTGYEWDVIIMTIRHLKVFVSVCENKSITRAAEKLYMTQPAVSKIIKELEDYYGIKLFDRISRRLYLTEGGKNFLGYSIHVVSLFDEMEKGIRNWDTFGILRIGASITIGTHLLPGYVSQFQKEHPQIRVQVVIENSEDLEKRILKNDVDFAFIEGTIHNPQLRFQRIMDDELILICGPHHALSKTKQLTIGQLPDYDFILREKGSGTRELFDSTLLVHDIAIKPIWESVSTQAIVKAVGADLGLSVLPYRLVKSDLEAGLIKHIKIKNVSFKRQFYITYHKNKYLTDSAKEFIDLSLQEGGETSSTPD